MGSSSSSGGLNGIMAAMNNKAADLKIRSYDKQIDRSRVEELERSCEVGPAESPFLLFTDTMGDPICRISNTSLYIMLVAEMDDELVGVIQGSIKIVTSPTTTTTTTTTSKDDDDNDQASTASYSVGYILGLRVSPVHRRKGIGSSLVRCLEEWFVTKNVDFAYMATEKDNDASVNLFINKLGFVQFRTLSILVNPVRHHIRPTPPTVEIAKLKIEQAEILYRRFMGSSTEFFPHDVDAILKNKLSLGTWVAYPRGTHDHHFEFNGLYGPGPSTSWAMLSVWNCGDLFKLRVGRAPMSWLIYSKSSRFMDQIFPCLNVPAVPDVFNPFGFYFMYGMHCEGPKSGPLMRSLCQFVHNMATSSKDTKVIVTEVGEWDSTLRLHIPHSKLLSRPEDLWCIKPLKTHQEKDTFFELTTSQPPSTAFFVDPREL